MGFFSTWPYHQRLEVKAYYLISVIYVIDVTYVWFINLSRRLKHHTDLWPVDHAIEWGSHPYVLCHMVIINNLNIAFL